MNKDGLTYYSILSLGPQNLIRGQKEIAAIIYGLMQTSLIWVLVFGGIFVLDLESGTYQIHEKIMFIVLGAALPVRNLFIFKKNKLLELDRKFHSWSRLTLKLTGIGSLILWAVSTYAIFWFVDALNIS